MNERNTPNSKTTDPSAPMNITDFLNLPLIEVLRYLVGEVVERKLSDPGLLAAIATAAVQTTAHTRQPESLDMDGALALLNDRGYRISRQQLYKLTSKAAVPFHKFGNKLHFKTAELLSWAECRLIDGNAIGYLPSRP